MCVSTWVSCGALAAKTLDAILLSGVRKAWEAKPQTVGLPARSGYRPASVRGGRPPATDTLNSGWDGSSKSYIVLIFSPVWVIPNLNKAQFFPDFSPVFSNTLHFAMRAQRATCTYLICSLQIALSTDRKSV